MLQIKITDNLVGSWRKVSAFLAALIVALPIAMVGVMVGAMVGAMVPANASEPENLPTIKVSATGQAQLTPDMAILNLSVVREAKSAREALNANNRAMKDVIAALQEAGIKPKDLQTANFNIQPCYNSRKSVSTNNQQPQIIGYQVSNSLSVKVRDLAILGSVLDRVVTLGVNSGGNVQFTNQNPDGAIAQARANAMKKAIAKAQTLVEAAGVKLGQIVSISEGVEAGFPVRAEMARASFKNVGGGAVPVAAGENTYKVTVHASWHINQP